MIPNINKIAATLGKWLFILLTLGGGAIYLHKQGQKQGKLEEKIENTEEVIDNEKERENIEAKVNQASIDTVSDVGSSFMRDE